MIHRHHYVEVVDREDWGMSGPTPVTMRYKHLICARCGRGQPRAKTRIDAITEFAAIFLICLWTLNAAEWLIGLIR